MNPVSAEIDWVETGVPRIPLGEWIETGFAWVQATAGEFFDLVADLFGWLVNGLTDLLQLPTPIAMIANQLL